MQKVRPAAVPEYEYRAACRLLDRCVREALAKPENQRAYEKWLKERKEKHG